MIPIIYPYKMGSESAKVLADSLGAKRVYPDGKYKPKRDHLIINWGNSKVAEWHNSVNARGITLNYPECVADAANKLYTFLILGDTGVPVPEWTTNERVAKGLLTVGARLFCRTLLNSHSGMGISVVSEVSEFIPAPLYTVDIGRRHEYRVHVFNGQVIDFQKKRRKNGYDNPNMDIRSHANGWVFCRDDINLPEKVGEVAKDAVRALSLNFGAVDVAYRGRTDEAFVFEVNTAPGLEGKTLDSYVKAIKELL